MDRAFASGAAGVPPSAPVAPSMGYSTKGNAGTGTPASKPGEWWYHMITEEQRAVIVAAGLTPDYTNVGQLAQAIQQLINAGGIKLPVRAATTANIAALAGGAPNALDGVALAANNRILVKDQATGSQNGIYVVTTLGTGANGTWTRATDADGVGELFAGLLVVVQEGTASADAVWELSTDGAITIGVTSISFVRKDAVSSAAVQGAFKNLQASSTGLNANVSVTVDEIAVENGSDVYRTLRAVNLAIAGTASGVANGLDTGALAASTWYSVWVIWNGATTAGLMSLSATAPTMPAGYTHKARVGWMRTDGTANKYPLAFTQKGRRVQYAPAAGSNLTALPKMAAGTAGSPSTPTWVSVAWGNFAPPTAAALSITARQVAAAGGVVIVAPNNSYGGYTSTTSAPPLIASGGSGVDMTTTASIIPESSNIYWASGGSASNYLATFGWEDNL